MKTISLLITLLICVNGYSKKTITVKSVKGFFEALDNNTDILIQTDNLDFTLENLEKELNLKEFYEHWSYSTATTERKPASYYLDSGIILYGYKNLKIRSESSTNIISTNDFDDILSFKNCTNITLENLSIFHTLETCNGSVLSLTLSKNVKVTNCNLNGSGGIGANLIGVNNVTFKNTDIFNNVFNAVFAVNSSNVKFNDCNIYSNHDWGDALIYSDISELSFKNCSIYDNQSASLCTSILKEPESNTTFTNCDIHDNVFNPQDFLDNPLYQNKKKDNIRIRKAKMNLLVAYLENELDSDHDSRNNELLSFFSNELKDNESFDFLHYYYRIKKKYFRISDYEYVNDKLIIVLNHLQSKKTIRWTFYFDRKNLINKLEEEDIK